MGLTAISFFSAEAMLFLVARDISLCFMLLPPIPAVHS